MARDHPQSTAHLTVCVVNGEIFVALLPSDLATRSQLRELSART
jgi:hypothetical protein